MQIFLQKQYSVLVETSHNKIRNEIKSRSSFDLSSEKEAEAIVGQFQHPHINLDTKSYTSKVRMNSPVSAAFYGPVPKTDSKEIAVVTYEYELLIVIEQKQIELLHFKPLRFTDTIFKVEIGGNFYKEFSFSIPTNYPSIELPELVILDVVRKRDKVLEAVQANVNALNENLTQLNQSFYKIALDSIQKRREHLAKMEYVYSRL